MKVQFSAVGGIIGQHLLSGYTCDCFSQDTMLHEIYMKKECCNRLLLRWIKEADLLTELQCDAFHYKTLVKMSQPVHSHTWF